MRSLSRVLEICPNWSFWNVLSLCWTKFYSFFCSKMSSRSFRARAWSLSFRFCIRFSSNSIYLMWAFTGVDSRVSWGWTLLFDLPSVKVWSPSVCVVACLCMDFFSFLVKESSINFCSIASFSWASYFINDSFSALSSAIYFSLSVNLNDYCKTIYLLVLFLSISTSYYKWLKLISSFFNLSGWGVPKESLGYIFDWSCCYNSYRVLTLEERFFLKAF